MIFESSVWREAPVWLLRPTAWNWPWQAAI